MTENGNISEFKGSTKQAIVDIRDDVKTLQEDVKSINQKMLIVFILLAVAVIERLPALINLAMAK